MTDLIGQLGSYQLGARLGSGGNGEVRRATGPSGEVAIKLLSQRENRRRDAQARFGNEISALKSLNGVKGVLPILDFDPNPEPAWFAMPIAVGLQDKLGDSPSFQTVVTSMAEIAQALAKVHERGLAHRDLKPENLFWWNDTWCLGDFGLVDIPDAETLTNSRNPPGSINYIAPEMLLNPHSADSKKSDIYSLSKVIWVKAICQRLPYRGVHDVVHRGVALRHNISDDRAVMLDELLRRMSLLGAELRPSAELVARELHTLSREDTKNSSLDHSRLLDRLRAVIAPHLSDETARENTLRLAQETVSPLRQTIIEIGKRIAASGFTRHGGASAPENWVYHQAIGEPSVEWSDEEGYYFNAGKQHEYLQLVIAGRWELLSGGDLIMYAGYRCEKFYGSRPSREITGIKEWISEERESCGMPSCRRAALQLSEKMESQLHEALEFFTERVSALG